MSDHMPNKIAGVVLHQYVNGNLITVMQPEAKIQVTMKTKRLHMEIPGPTAEKKEGARMSVNDLNPGSASPLANARPITTVNRRQ